MLDNEFDKIFRDRLLDHPSRIRHGLWKQVHSQLVRYHAFWKWYFVGPSAIAVAVTGHLLVAMQHHPSPSTRHDPTATVHAATRAAAATAPATTAITMSPAAAITMTPAADPAAPNAAPSAAPTSTAAIASPSSRAPAADPSHHRRSNAQQPGAHTAAHPSRPSDVPASARPPIAATAARAPIITRPPIPAQLTAQTKRATLKSRPDITAVTSNPKKPHALILPAPLSRKTTPLRLDVFGAPEYFTLSTFGLSYGAGIRMTYVYKGHWTLTSGLQYLRIGLPGTTKDSARYLPAGTIKNIHLPILLGYTMGNQRFTFSANAGILLSLYAHAAGKVTETGWYWPNRNGLNALLSLDFASRVTDRFSIFAEPYMKCWYPPYMHFPSQVWSTGLMLGVRFDF